MGGQFSPREGRYALPQFRQALSRKPEIVRAPIGSSLKGAIALTEVDLHQGTSYNDKVWFAFSIEVNRDNG
jgi:hypothetical protein